MSEMVAALYVETGGAYFGLEGVDPWDEERDARLYPGPHPVVAHPPCKRWGRYWSGGPSAKVRRVKGDDDGCFAAALHAVQTFGGVIEHPEASHAWLAFKIRRPPKRGGWVTAGLYAPGWSCCVEQGHYGHACRKATWLYAVGCERPELKWGKADGCARMEQGGDTRTKAQALATRAAPGYQPLERIAKSARAGTPPAFRDLLLDMARGCS